MIRRYTNLLGRVVFNIGVRLLKNDGEGDIFTVRNWDKGSIMMLEITSIMKDEEPHKISAIEVVIPYEGEIEETYVGLKKINKEIYETKSSFNDVFLNIKNNLPYIKEEKKKGEGAYRFSIKLEENEMRKNLDSIYLAFILRKENVDKECVLENTIDYLTESIANENLIYGVESINKGLEEEICEDISEEGLGRTYINLDTRKIYHILGLEEVRNEEYNEQVELVYSKDRRENHGTVTMNLSLGKEILMLKGGNKVAIEDATGREEEYFKIEREIEEGSNEETKEEIREYNKKKKKELGIVHLQEGVYYSYRSGRYLFVNGDEIDIYDEWKNLSHYSNNRIMYEERVNGTRIDYEYDGERLIKIKVNNNEEIINNYANNKIESINYVRNKRRYEFDYNEENKVRIIKKDEKREEITSFYYEFNEGKLIRICNEEKGRRMEFEYEGEEVKKVKYLKGSEEKNYIKIERENEYIEIENKKGKKKEYYLDSYKNIKAIGEGAKLWIIKNEIIEEIGMRKIKSIEETKYCHNFENGSFENPSVIYNGSRWEKTNQGMTISVEEGGLKGGRYLKITHRNGYNTYLKQGRIKVKAGRYKVKGYIKYEGTIEEGDIEVSLNNETEGNVHFVNESINENRWEYFETDYLEVEEGELEVKITITGGASTVCLDEIEISGASDLIDRNLLIDRNFEGSKWNIVGEDVSAVNIEQSPFYGENNYLSKRISLQKVMKIKNGYIEQEVSINGKEGDIYRLSLILKGEISYTSKVKIKIYITNYQNVIEEKEYIVDEKEIINFFLEDIQLERASKKIKVRIEVSTNTIYMSNISLEKVNNKTEVEYDKEGRLLKINGIEEERVGRIYLNNQGKIDDEKTIYGTSSFCHVYNQNNLMISSLINGINQEVEYEGNKVKKKTLRDSSITKEIEYEYSQDNNLEKIDIGEEEIRYVYDTSRRIIEKEGEYKENYAYDKDYISSYTVNENATINYEYEEGKISEVSNSKNVYKYTYTRKENLEAIQNNNEEIERYIYDEDSNMIGKEENEDKYEYIYDEEGRIKEIKINSESKTKYEYDEIGRVTRIYNEEENETYLYGEGVIDTINDECIIEKEGENNKRKRISFIDKNKEYEYSYGEEKGNIKKEIYSLGIKYESDVIIPSSNNKGLFGISKINSKGIIIKKEDELNMEEYLFHYEGSYINYNLSTICSLKRGKYLGKEFNKEEYINKIKDDLTINLFMKIPRSGMNRKILSLRDQNGNIVKSITINTGSLEPIINSKYKEGEDECYDYHLVTVKIKKVASVCMITTSIDNKIINEDNSIALYEIGQIEIGDSSIEGYQEANKKYYVGMIIIGRGLSVEEQEEILNILKKHLYVTRIKDERGVTYLSSKNEEMEMITLSSSFKSNKGKEPFIVENPFKNGLFTKESYFKYDEKKNKNVYQCFDQSIGDLVSPSLLTNKSTLGYSLSLNNKVKIMISFRKIGNYRSKRNIVSIMNVNMTSERIGIYLNSENKIEINKDGTRYVTELKIEDEEWHVIGIYYEVTTFKVYLDNRNNVKSLDGEPLFINDCKMMIGNSTLDSSITLNGYIEYVGVSKNMTLSSFLDYLEDNKKYITNYKEYDATLLKENVIRVKGHEYRTKYIYNNDKLEYVEYPYIDKKYRYSFDSRGRLNYIEDFNIHRTKERYYYDSYSRVIRSQIENDEENITYDNSGNITSRTIIESGQSKTLTYSYQGDKLMSVVDSSTQEEEEFVYMNNKLTRRGDINLSWEGRLLTQYGSYLFTYNIHGLRKRKYLDSTHYENYIYDENKLIRLIGKNGDEEYDFIYHYDENDILIGFESNDKEYFYERDALGKILSIIDEDGTRIVKYSYDAWGYLKQKSILILGVEANYNPFIYKGYFYDKETQLYWVSSRYYSPELCRWISPDSIEYLDPQSINGLNLYAYCGNDPINKYDPTGHFGIWALVAITAASMLIGGTAQLVSNAMAGKTGSELWRGVAGAAVGAGVNALALCLAMPTGGASLFIAAGASAIAQTGVDTLETVIRGEEVDVGQTFIDLGLNFVTTLAGNYLGGKMIPTNRGWIQTQRFWSVFTKPYGQKILLQTAIGAGLSGTVNFIRKNDWSKYKPIIPMPVLPLYPLF